MVLLLICGLAGAPAGAHETSEVTRRRAVIHYRRDPGPPLGAVPRRLSDSRAGARAQFRTVSPPVFFPVPAEQLPGLPTPRKPRTWAGRRAERQREIIREEFAARGYPLPD